MVMELAGCGGGTDGIGAGAGICCPWALATTQKARENAAQDRDGLEELMDEG
jgi:hypothetical protein